jgi:hypothetical protein
MPTIHHQIDVGPTRPAMVWPQPDKPHQLLYALAQGHPVPGSERQG